MTKHTISPADSKTPLHYYIYTLSNPVNNALLYVGCTVNLKSRYNDHMSNHSERLPMKRKEYIDDLKAEGIQLVMEVIDEIDSNNSRYVYQIELAWIRIMELRCGELLNEHTGSEIRNEQEAFDRIARFKELNRMALANPTRQIKLRY